MVPRCTMVVPPCMAGLGEQRGQRTGMRPITRLLTCFPHPFFWVYERFSERSLTPHLS